MVGGGRGSLSETCCLLWLFLANECDQLTLVLLRSIKFERLYDSGDVMCISDCLCCL